MKVKNMKSKPLKAVLIGLDGANYEAIKPLLKKGLLPNISKLLKTGVLCENAYATYPTLTGSNWASIATGAWPGTHGVTDMSYHVTGEPLDYWHSGFISDAVEAETLWEALAKVDKKSIVLKYPGSWPPRHKDITIIDGGGGRPFWGGSFLEISHSQLFSTESIPNGNVVKVAPAKGWKSLPPSNLEPLEVLIHYIPESGRIPEFLQFKGEPVRLGKPIDYWALIYADSTNGYDTLALCRGKDYSKRFTVLKEGDISDSLEVVFGIQGKKKRGSMLLALEFLHPKTGFFDLYFSQVYPTDEFTQPPELGAELVNKFGAYFDHPAFSEQGMGWFRRGPETYLKFMEYQNDWFGKAGRYLLETQRWDFFAIQCHCIDYANHNFVYRHGWTQQQKEQNLQHLARCYKSVDQMIGKILQGAGDNCLVCVLSDHGATESPNPELNLNKVLEEHGFLTYQESTQSSGRPRIDRSKTLAEQQRCSFIYLNLQGRDPGGIIPPEQYEQVREKIMDALKSYKEPHTGRNPFSLILKKEDARIMGLYDSLGRDVGDIIYALYPEFDHEHGRQLPNAVFGQQSVQPLMIFSGPGIKEGLKIQRSAWVVDVVPTIAYAMNWPFPTEAEGAILFQLFESHKSSFPRPDFMKKQLQHLKQVQKNMRTSPGKKASVGKLNLPKLQKLSTSKSSQEQKMPSSVEELKKALVEARNEAQKWKSAYEQYQRITHGN